jgi:hypothetical protein
VPKLRAKWDELHPARAALEELIDSKAAALHEDSEIRKAIVRFDELARSADAVQADLTALDASERAAFDSWARNPSKPAPTVDSARRAELHLKLVEAKAKADAGARAATEMHSKLAEHGRRIADADRSIVNAIPNVMLDEYERPPLDAVRSTGAEMLVSIAKLNRFRDHLYAIVRSLPRDAASGELHRRLEGLDAAIRSSLQRPDESAVNDAAHAGWLDLSHRLRSDARAEFSDAPAEPLSLDEIMRRREQALRAA